MQLFSKTTLFMIVLSISFVFATNTTFKIVGNSCNFWNKDGSIYSGDHEILKWQQKCGAFSAYDIYFNNDTTQFARTETEMFTILTTIKLYDSQNKLVVTFDEDFSLSYENRYSIYNTQGNLIAISNIENFFDSKIYVYDVEKNLIAWGIQEFGNKFEQSICKDGQWYLNFNETQTTFLAQEENRWILSTFLTIKAVRDTDRGSDGKMRKPFCQSFYQFLIIGIPVIAVVAIVFVVIFIRFYCKQNRRSGYTSL